MGDAPQVVMASAKDLTPEGVASRTFTSAFRGYHPAEVRQFLKQVSEELAASAGREAELRRSLQTALNRAAHPDLDEDAVTAALGEHAAHLLGNARQTAAAVVADGQRQADALLRDAESRVARMREEAEGLLARRMAEADAATASVRRETEDAVRALVEQARASSEAEVEQARQQGRDMVAEARDVRERMLGDLTRRKRVAVLQVEQLRAARQRLLAAYDVVRRTVEEATAELDAAEPEARLAAEAVARRAEALEPPAGPARPAPAPPVRARPAPAPVPAPADAAPERALAFAATAGSVSRTAATDRPAPPPALLRRGPASEPPPVDQPPALRPQTVADAVARSTPAASPAPSPSEPSAPGNGNGNGNGNGHGGDAERPEHRVDDVFARIRADQASPPAEAAPATPDGPPAHTPAPVLDPVASEQALARRDALLDDVEAGLTRALKRAMQDEENDVLDRLRRLGMSDAAGVLPEADARTSAYAAVALPWLHQAARAGVGFASGPTEADPGGDAAYPSLDPLAAAVAAELAGSLPDRLAQALADGDDATVAAESVRAAYRQGKLQRVEAGARHAVLEAFSTGAYAAMPTSTAVQWVVEEEGHCSDCDDNALAGPTPKGEPFPTGQLHPPAHPGCRCLLAPAPA